MSLLKTFVVLSIPWFCTTESPHIFCLVDYFHYGIIAKSTYIVFGLGPLTVEEVRHLAAKMAEQVHDFHVEGCVIDTMSNENVMLGVNPKVRT